MPCPKSSQLDQTNLADEDEKKPEESPYEKLMYSLHNDPKWLQEVNLGRRVGLYKFRCELGCGNFSQVKLAVHQLTKERVAVKIVDKGKLDDKMMRMLNQEISTMEAIHHPNLIRLYEVVETYGKLFLVMEYASGGELYNRVTTSGKLEELVARNLFAQICSAVRHMHERQIIHRDIKAENVFFSGPNRVKLGDFGFSAKVTERNQRLNTFCGSPPYAAPELFCDENYLGEPVDIWALGVLLYFMVVGRMPFKGQNIPTLKANIVAGVYEVPKRLSKECAELIEGIIRQNPEQRLRVSSILASDWLKGVPLPSVMDANQQYSLAPTIAKFPAGDICVAQYSDVEKTARERLAELGISSHLLESQHSQGSRSHIIGSYRIVVHRVQKQLCSFVEVDGFLPPRESSPEKKPSPPPPPPPPEKHKKLENKFQLSRILGRSSSSEDLFSDCWRRKASSDDETDAKEKLERLSLGEKETIKKAKMVLLNNRSAQSAKGGSGNPTTTAVVQSTTCSIL